MDYRLCFIDDKPTACYFLGKGNILVSTQNHKQLVLIESLCKIEHKHLQLHAL